MSVAGAETAAFGAAIRASFAAVIGAAAGLCSIAWVGWPGVDR